MFDSPESILRAFENEDYLMEERVAITLFLAIKLEKPLLIEGPAGVGKTELAKTLAKITNSELIRLQCYEGLDEGKALYEWDYSKQLLLLQTLSNQEGSWQDTKRRLFQEDFLLERPILKALRSNKPTVLLIDEIDKADEEFESFLLEALSDFQISIPELGTIRANKKPMVVLTSNSERSLTDPLKRRSVHLVLDFPPLEKELRIIELKVPNLRGSIAQEAVDFIHRLRKLKLRKQVSIAESIDWARTLDLLEIDILSQTVIDQTLGVLVKDQEDLLEVQQRLKGSTGNA